MKEAKLRRKKIRKEDYAIGGMLVLTFLAALGLFFIYLSGFFSVKSWNMLYDCIYNHGIELIWGLFFVFLYIYIWILYFMNFVLPPKRDVVYLSKTRERGICFIDKKGRKYEYNIRKKSIKWNTYYHVIRTHNYILKIQEEAEENWKPKEKKSFWFNFYTPFGNVEDAFILPIVYLIAFPVLLACFMSKGEARFYWFLFCSFPIYILLYDIVYKIKLRFSEDNKIDETGFKNSYKIFKNCLFIIIAFLITLGSIIAFRQLPDDYSKIFSVLIIGFGICTIGLAFSRIFNKNKLSKIFQKGYIVVFLLYWFGIILGWIFSVPKTKDSIPLLLFPMPFWIVGFIILFRFVIEENKEDKKEDK